ncbi:MULTISPECIES: hypothetical protein [unclassified Bradyrhizobium]|nr:MULTISPECIES: hypothetical protein [unclassified Bradyrhizobium]
MKEHPPAKMTSREGLAHLDKIDRIHIRLVARAADAANINIAGHLAHQLN